MKTLAILALAAVTATAAPTEQELRQQVYSTCTSVSKMAGAVMERRQEGTSMMKVLSAITSDEGDTEHILQYFRSIVYDAYKVPRYTSSEYKQRAIEDFVNDKAARCLADFGEVQ